MTVGFYGHWNKSLAPVNCDGWTYYGSPYQSGFVGFGGNIGLGPGSYYAVWFNLSPDRGTLINVTIAVTAESYG